MITCLTVAPPAALAEPARARLVSTSRRRAEVPALTTCQSCSLEIVRIGEELRYEPARFIAVERARPFLPGGMANRSRSSPSFVRIRGVR